MSTNREKVRSAVLAGIKKHESAKKNPNLKKNELLPFNSISAICNYLYEFEFLMDKKLADEAKEEGRNIDKCVIASKNTIRSVIDELLNDGVLQRKGDEYVLTESYSSERARFPILQIADRIPIEMLPPEDIMFLSAPTQYVSAITDYINAVFYKKDITATAIGDLIMCMSVYPKEAYEEGFVPDEEHSERFFCQLTGALADFDLAFRDFKYGDNYYLKYGQRYDPLMIRVVDELARNMVTFDGRAFNKRTYEKYKYFISSAMSGTPTPPSLIDDLKRDDPVLYKHIDEVLNSLCKKN